LKAQARRNRLQHGGVVRICDVDYLAMPLTRPRSMLDRQAQIAQVLEPNLEARDDMAVIVGHG
jgi:hypothetical protein